MDSSMMDAVAESGDDERVRIGWLMLGRWDRALPELRAFPRAHAQRIWQRAWEWARRDPWVRWPFLVVYAGWVLVSAGTLALLLLGYLPSAQTTFQILMGLQLSFPAAVLLVRWLTFARTRKHVRLEIGTLCPDCGYDLRGGQLDWRTGLADPKTGQFNCPECGVALRRVYVEEERAEDG